MSLLNSQDNFGFKPLRNNQNENTQEEEKDQDFGFKPLQSKTKFQEEQALIDEDTDPEIERHLARFTSRGLEQVGGLPGNLRDLAYSIKDYYKENKPKALKELKEPEAFGKFEKAIPIAKTISGLLDYLPTSSKLQKKSEELSKGYTKPKNEFENSADELFGKIVASALPGQGQRNIWRNIAAPIAGQFGKEIVKKLGVGEKGQILTDIGLNIALPLMGANAATYNRELWRNLQNNIPNTAVNVNQGRQRAQNLVHRLQTQGLGSAGETRVITTLNNFLDNTQNGQMSAAQLVGFNRSLNEIRGDPSLLTGSRTLLNDVSNIIRESGRPFEQIAPQFYRDWLQANEVHGAIQNSNHIARVVEKAVDKSPLKSEAARALFGAATHAAAKTASTVPPIYAIYKGTQILQRMGSSPTLFRYYTNILSNSLRGNTAQVAANLNKLDEALLKEENSPKPPLKSQKKSPSPKK